MSREALEGSEAQAAFEVVAVRESPEKLVLRHGITTSPIERNARSKAMTSG